MINLDKVTLVIVDCLHYKEAKQAVLSSIEKINFATIKVFTDKPEEFSDIPNTTIIVIDKISNKFQYCEFITRKLNNYIDTDFVLIIQWDGYVKNPNAWEDEFLEYDYIGAPWWYSNISEEAKNKATDAFKSWEFNVGNGGFSLRSSKLLNIVQNDPHIKEIYPEDHHICRTYGNYLRSKGIKFAPEEVASRFAIEGCHYSKYGTVYRGQFGFHNLELTHFFSESRTNSLNRYKQKAPIICDNSTISVWMPELERNTIAKYLNTSDIMLEWGAGGSTLYFSKFVKQYYSIEHDKEYYNNILKEINTNNIILRLVQSNYPRTLPTKEEEFKDYIKAVSLFNTKFDKVLIDGRARQWCGVEVLPFLSDNAVVFVHDWVRERYHSLLAYYEIIEEIKSNETDANGLVVLKKR